MHPGAATHRTAAAWLVASSLFVACGSAPPAYRPGDLTPEQFAVCRDAELAYHASLARGAAAEDDAGAKDGGGKAVANAYPALKQRILQDPVMTAWLVRVFIRDLILVREVRPLDDKKELFRAAAGIEDPVEARALAEIRDLGAAAVPTLVGDLLLHSQPQPRELGVELLSLIGAAAVPALQQVARTGEVRPRRSAVRALGRIGITADVLPVLRELANDADFAVRADAVRSITGGGEPARALLLERLQQDGDAYVRRVAAEALGNFPGRTTALALVDFLERCRRERDADGEVVAQKTLQRLAGARSMREPAAWRQHPWSESPAAPIGATGNGATKGDSK